MRTLTAIAAVLALAGASACEVNVSDENQATTANEAAAPQPTPQQRQQEARLQQMRDQARQEMQDLKFLVDISDRELRIMQGDQVIRTHDVAVGTEEWPTPTGSWELHQVDMNPEWVPPTSEEWAEDEETTAPGDPDNPMGRARLVYRMPNTIHGTDDLESLGKASSHGSIRVANEVVLQLAELLMKAGGAWEGPQWFRQMAENRTREYQVELSEPVPIQVQD